MRGEDGRVGDAKLKFHNIVLRKIRPKDHGALTTPSNSTILPSNRPRPPKGVKFHPPTSSRLSGQSSRVGSRGNGGSSFGRGLVRGRYVSSIRPLVAKSDVIERTSVEDHEHVRYRGKRQQRQSCVLDVETNHVGYLSFEDPYSTRFASLISFRVHGPAYRGYSYNSQLRGQVRSRVVDPYEW